MTILFFVLVGLIVLLIALLSDKIPEFDYEKLIRKSAELFGRKLRR